jgi:amidase
MKRRDFLRNGSLAGMAMSAASIQAFGHDEPGRDKSPSHIDSFPLLEVTISDLQQKMKSGELSSRKVTEQYLARIRSIDQSGPALRSVIEVNPDALKIADQMDRERKAGKLRGPLHGIPILVKDNIDTADQMMTTAGSIALLDHRASKDAFVVQQLRKAGAVIIGKTNLSEWANFRSTRSGSGWSSRGGQTRNPYVLNRNPSGSSSGSGVAVSANLCTAAVGTETDGSVTAPASCNGIVGLKPTVGLVSRSGIIPISATQDTAGPMARCVRDAAILLGAMTGVDPLDPVTAESSGKAQDDYTVFTDHATLKGKRIGVEKRHLQGHEGVVGLYQAAIDLMKAQGAEIVEVELLKLTATISPSERLVLQYEFKDGLNKYFQAHNTRVKSLEALIRFNQDNAARAMPWFRQETLEASQQKGGLDSAEYQEALKRTTGTRKVIDDLMKDQSLDVIIGVSMGIPGCSDLVNGDYGTGFYFASPAAMAGYPHITVPMGHVHGLPVGLSFVSGAYSEGPLLGIAHAYEQASKKRRAPAFMDMPAI